MHVAELVQRVGKGLLEAKTHRANDYHLMGSRRAANPSYLASTWMAVAQARTPLALRVKVGDGGAQFFENTESSTVLAVRSDLQSLASRSVNLILPAT